MGKIEFDPSNPPTLEQIYQINGRPNGRNPMPGTNKRYSQIHRPELYHSYKNKEMFLSWSWFLCTPLLWVFGWEGIALQVIAWIVFFVKCHENNRALDRDPYTRFQRDLADGIPSDRAGKF